MPVVGMVFEKKEGTSLVRILSTITSFICLAFAGTGFAADQHVILTGSGGELEFSLKFFEWGERLEKIVSQSSKSDQTNVHWLREKIELDGENEIINAINAESIEETIKDAIGALEESDSLFVYLIGHGSYFKSIPKFHIPGPDITAEQMLEWFEPVEDNRIIIVNTTSSSAPFINTLSGKNRMVCTATKSASEFNAPEFTEYFLVAMEDGSADLNRDDRISFLEACQQAAELTKTWYENAGTISTEHSLIDDNGDGQGTRLERSMDITGDFDGLLASNCFIKSYQFPDEAPQDLIDEYIETLEKVKELKTQKSSLVEIEYYEQLEKLLIHAAGVNREIQSFAVPVENGNT